MKIFIQGEIGNSALMTGKSLFFTGRDVPFVLSKPKLE